MPSRSSPPRPRRSVSPRQPHLERNRSGFFWRRRWPLVLLDSKWIHRPFLSFSLRTHFPADAKILAARLTALSDQVFAALVENEMPIAPAVAEQILIELARFEIAAFEQVRRQAPTRSPEAAEADQRRETAIQDTLRAALYLRDREVARAPLRHIADRLGLHLDETDPDWQGLALEATRVLLDVSQERQRRDRGQYDGPTRFFRAALRQHQLAVSTPPAEVPDWGPATAVPLTGAFASSPAIVPSPSGRFVPAPAPTPSQSVEPATATDLQSALERPEPAIPAPQSAHAAAAASPARPRGLLIGRAFDLYLETRCAGKAGEAEDEVASIAEGDSYQRNSLGNEASSKRMLLRYFGDIPLGRLGKKELTEFFSLFQKIPANHGKSPNEPQDLRELVARADSREATAVAERRAQLEAQGQSLGNIEAALLQERIPRLKVNTVYRHMQEVQRMLEHMVALGHLAANPMKGVIWNTKRKNNLLALEEDEGRKPWEREHVTALCTSRIYQNPLQDPGDPLFWAPLIALLGGLREEAALQLGTEDVREIDGVVVFDLCKGPGKHFKTDASIRRVPVHKTLIDLGLLELVRLRRQQGEVRLFPHLKRHEKRKTFSANFTKDFTRYRQTEKIYDPQRDFHALRTTFNVELIKNRVDAVVRKHLMGHAINDVNWESYRGDGFTLEHLRDIVNLIEIDTSMIRKPFNDDPVAVDLASNGPQLRVVR